jgi:hypothetical protein
VAGTVLELRDLIPTRDGLAVSISNSYSTWDSLRAAWMKDRSELRNYIFATDTRSTSNAQLPWKNSTTIPKLTQIRDNLHANYMSALFPHSEWLQWEGNELNDSTQDKRRAIESYMRTKLRQDKATITVSQLLLDYIDNGNCFATCEWVDDSVKDDETGEITRGYVGPRIVRISPFDIVFNPTAPSFEKSPKIIRAVKTLGELAAMAEDMPKDSDQYKMFNKAITDSTGVRKQVASLSQGDTIKSAGFQIDGFGSIQQYFGSDFVEVLTFFGDLFDIDSKKFLRNYVISIIDRSFVIAKRQNPNWTTNGGIFHAGWRQRPDNLYAMGPLDNLVGMQYRIDHLENLKADVFDMIGYPMQKVKGYVLDYEYGPGHRIYTGDDGDVEFMHPDVTALNADTQILELERRMEELAGAPKEAMGIRTPGEKTKFEVQTLDNAASRIFQNKIRHFEEVFFEPLLNYGLQLARKNMSSSDVARTLDSEVDAVIFSTITKEDLVANGILRPVGASHFAYKANVLQNVLNMMNSAVAQDEQVKIHISGKKLAKLIEELADLDKFKIYGDNIRVVEQAETTRLMNSMKDRTDAQSITPSGIGADVGAPPSGPIPPGVGQPNLEELSAQ